MLQGKLPISILGGVILGLLFLAAGSLLGPGIRDEPFAEIVDGYGYFDAGGYEKMIIYDGEKRLAGVVIDARVDDFYVDGARLLVARRPRVTNLAKDDAVDSRLLSECEFWVINTKFHTVKQVAQANEVQCK